MRTLHDQIEICQEEALVAAIKAKTAETPQVRAEYTHIESHWRHLVETLRFVETIGSYMEWSARRLVPPPP